MGKTSPECRRRWARANPEKVLEHQRTFRRKHPELMRAQYRKWYWEHREQKLAYMKRTKKERMKATKKWRAKNEERFKQYQKEYAKENRERIAKISREWRDKNPERSRMRTRRYRARRKKADGSFTLEEWENLKKMYDCTCPDCDKKEPEIKLEADHIIPLDRGGSNFIWNIQPLCKSCNSSKGSKYLPDKEEEQCKDNVPNVAKDI